jgi:ankyrin repeat protein
MLAAGARVNLKDNRGRTALFDALEQGHYSIAKELLRVGAKTNVRDRNEMTPLETLRQQENSPDMTGTEWLISAGVSVDAKKQEAERAAWQRRRAQMITFLEKHSRNGK